MSGCFDGILRPVGVKTSVDTLGLERLAKICGVRQ